MVGNIWFQNEIECWKNEKKRDESWKFLPMSDSGYWFFFSNLSLRSGLSHCVYFHRHLVEPESKELLRTSCLRDILGLIVSIINEASGLRVGKSAKVCPRSKAESAIFSMGRTVTFLLFCGRNKKCDFRYIMRLSNSSRCRIHSLGPMGQVSVWLMY